MKVPGRFSQKNAKKVIFWKTFFFHLWENGVEYSAGPEFFSSNPKYCEVSENIWFYGVLSTLKWSPEKVGGETAPPAAAKSSF